MPAPRAEQVAQSHDVIWVQENARRQRGIQQLLQALGEGDAGRPDTGPRATTTKHLWTMRVVRAEGPPLLERIHVQHAAATMNFGTACSSDTSWRHIQRGGEVISVDEDPKADLQVAQHGTDANRGRTGSLGSRATVMDTYAQRRERESPLHKKSKWRVTQPFTMHDRNRLWYMPATWKATFASGSGLRGHRSSGPR